uniref:Uncharacterized protein n=1 Tax=uncultured bacterium TB157_p TaxID=1552133 RepID=A0A0K0LBH7_9BACT|nr:hypothetical protein [uncultured bacterium TB157_p]
MPGWEWGYLRRFICLPFRTQHTRVHTQAHTSCTCTITHGRAHTGTHGVHTQARVWINTDTHPCKNTGTYTERHTSHVHTQAHTLSPWLFKQRLCHPDFHTPASWFYGQIITSCKAESLPL